MKYSIDDIAGCLREGGVILTPTDTVYGLAVMPHLPESIDVLYALKQRPKTSNLPIMVSSVEDLDALGVEINDRVKQVLTPPFVPGNLTLIMGFKGEPGYSWLEGREEIAVRIPNHPMLLSVLQATGPLLVTSANRHGVKDTPTNIQDILDQLNGSPALSIEGTVAGSIPSTILNCRHDPPVIEREGVIRREELERLTKIR